MIALPQRPEGASFALRAAALVVLAPGCSCGGAGEATDAGASTDAGGASTVVTTTTTTSATVSTHDAGGAGGAGGSTTGQGGAEPCPDWPGWVRWKDFAADCSLCAPASKAALPAPIEWVPCDPMSGMPSGCRQMKADWPYWGTPFAVTAGVDVSQPGRPVLDITRVSAVGPKQFKMKVIAEADGPVRTAFLDPRGQGIKGCTFNSFDTVSVGQGKFAMEIIDGDASGKGPEAAVGGDFDELHPHVVAAWNASEGHALTPSDSLWATWDSAEVGVAKWGEPWKVVFNGGQVGGLQQQQARAWHDFVYWRSSDGVYQGAMAWTPAKGAYPFLTYPGDWSRGVEGLGTDGVHMVWIYEEGKGPKQEPYPKRSVMVSPFTTDPAALQPKRLRSYPSSSSEAQILTFAVGCGYAAIATDPRHVLVVRLKDGVSWTLHAPDKVDAAVPYMFSKAYAITCDEVFVRGGANGEMNIARVRLDALGPGILPD